MPKDEDESDLDLEVDSENGFTDSSKEAEGVYIHLRCTIDEDHMCPVCLNESIGPWIGIPDACNHAFCADCILEWSKNSSSCPIDRLKFTSVSVYDKDTREFHHSIAVSEVEVQKDFVDGIFCQICQSPFDEDTLLLCDGCDLGFHCACLTPSLSEVPHDEWFCPSCRNLRAVEPNVGPPLRILGRTRATERVRAEVYESRVRRSHAGDLGSQINDIVNDILGRAGSRFHVVKSAARKKGKRKKKLQKKRKRRRYAVSKPKRSEKQSAKISTGNNSTGIHQPLLLCGSSTEFDEYLARDIEETPRLLSEKHKQLSASALRFNTPLPSVLTLGRRAIEVGRPSPIPDLLSDIICRQEILTMPSNRICIRKNGTLHVKDITERSKFSIKSDSNNMPMEVSDSGGSGERGAGVKNGNESKHESRPSHAPSGGVASSSAKGSCSTAESKSAHKTGVSSTNSNSNWQSEDGGETISNLASHTNARKHHQVAKKAESQRNFKSVRKIQIRQITSLPHKHTKHEMKEVYDPFSPTDDDNAEISHSRTETKETHHCNIYDPFEPTESDEEKEESSTVGTAKKSTKNLHLTHNEVDDLLDSKLNPSKEVTVSAKKCDKHHLKEHVVDDPLDIKFNPSKEVTVTAKKSVENLLTDHEVDDLLDSKLYPPKEVTLSKPHILVPVVDMFADLESNSSKKKDKDVSSTSRTSTGSESREKRNKTHSPESVGLKIEQHDRFKKLRKVGGEAKEAIEPSLNKTHSPESVGLKIEEPDRSKKVTKVGAGEAKEAVEPSLNKRHSPESVGLKIEQPDQSKEVTKVGAGEAKEAVEPSLNKRHSPESVGLKIEQPDQSKKVTKVGAGEAKKAVEPSFNKRHSPESVGLKIEQPDRSKKLRKTGAGEAKGAVELSLNIRNSPESVGLKIEQPDRSKKLRKVGAGEAKEAVEPSLNMRNSPESVGLKIEQADRFKKLRKVGAGEAKEPPSLKNSDSKGRKKSSKCKQYPSNHGAKKGTPRDTSPSGDWSNFQAENQKNEAIEKNRDKHHTHHKHKKHKRGRNRIENRAWDSPVMSADSSTERVLKKRVTTRTDEQSVDEFSGDERKNIPVVKERQSSKKRRKEKLYERRLSREEVAELPSDQDHSSRKKRRVKQGRANSTAQSGSRSPRKTSYSPVKKGSGKKDKSRRKHGTICDSASSSMSESEIPKHTTSSNQRHSSFDTQDLQESKDHDSSKKKKKPKLAKHKKEKVEYYPEKSYSGKSKSKKRRKNEHEETPEAESPAEFSRSDSRRKRMKSNKHVPVVTGKKIKDQLKTSHKHHRHKDGDSSNEYSEKRSKNRKKKRRLPVSDVENSPSLCDRKYVPAEISDSDQELRYSTKGHKSKCRRRSPAHSVEKSPDTDQRKSKKCKTGGKTHKDRRTKHSVDIPTKFPSRSTEPREVNQKNSSRLPSDAKLTEVLSAKIVTSNVSSADFSSSDEDSMKNKTALERSVTTPQLSDDDRVQSGGSPEVYSDVSSFQLVKSPPRTRDVQHEIGSGEALASLVDYSEDEMSGEKLKDLSPLSSISLSPQSHNSSYYTTSPSQNIKETLSYAEEFLEQSRRRWNERKKDNCAGVTVSVKDEEPSQDTSLNLPQEREPDSRTQDLTPSIAELTVDIFAPSPVSKDITEFGNSPQKTINACPKDKDSAQVNPDAIRHAIEMQDDVTAPEGLGVTPESRPFNTDESDDVNLSEVDQRSLPNKTEDSPFYDKRTSLSPATSCYPNPGKQQEEPVRREDPQPIKIITGHTCTDPHVMQDTQVVSEEEIDPENLMPKRHQHVSNSNLIVVRTRALSPEKDCVAQKAALLPTAETMEDSKTGTGLLNQGNDSGCLDTTSADGANSEKDSSCSVEAVSSVLSEPFKLSEFGNKGEDEPATDGDPLSSVSDVANITSADGTELSLDVVPEKSSSSDHVILNPTQILNIIGLNPQQKSAAQNAILSIAELSKRLQLDKVMGSAGKPSSLEEQNQDSPISIDNIASSAVAMYNKDRQLGLLKKVQFQELVAEEAKLAIKPYYESREISKSEYKEIMKRAVNKICSTEKSLEVNSVKIRRLIRRYIEKYREKNNVKKEKMRSNLNTQIQKVEKRRSPSPPPYQPLSPNDGDLCLKKTPDAHLGVDTPSLLKRQPRQIVTLPDLPLPPPPPPPPRRSNKMP